MESGYFYCRLGIIKRSKGHSVVAGSAYRSRSKLYNEYNGITYDYTKKGSRRNEKISSEILLPVSAPKEFQNRETLWNSVEKKEKAKNSQLAREIQLGLPNDLTPEEQKSLTRLYIQKNFVDKGMCADLSFHDKGDGNPHVHVLLTMRSLDENGNWMDKKRKQYILDENGNKQYDPIKKTYKFKTIKTNDWNEKENAEKWREAWAKTIEREYQRKGIEKTVDHRSYKRQGLDKIPGRHLGPEASAMEARGIKTYLGDINREIEKDNMKMMQVREEEKLLRQKVQELKIINTKPIEQAQGNFYNQGNELSVSFPGETKQMTPVINDRLSQVREEPLQASSEDISGLRQQYRRLAGQGEDLNERVKLIEDYNRKIGELQKLRDEKSFGEAKERKNIENKLKMLESSREKATNTLDRDYGIKPEEAERRARVLEKQAGEIKDKMEMAQREREKTAKDQEKNKLIERDRVFQPSKSKEVGPKKSVEKELLR